MQSLQYVKEYSLFFKNPFFIEWSSDLFLDTAYVNTLNTIYIYICIYIYLPNPPHEQRAEFNRFESRVFLFRIQLSYKGKKFQTSLLFTHSWKREMIGFIRFSKVLALCETQTV